MFDVNKLLLKEKYSVDVKVNYSSNYWVSGILNISQDNITLIIYGETHEKSDYKYNGQFKQLICTNYLNTVFILLDVTLIKSHSARLSQDIGSFYNEYQVSELLFNKDHRSNIANFSQISFKSKDLQKWIGHTQLQNDIIDEYFSKKNNQLDTKELLIEIGNMYLIIHYPTNQYWSPDDYRAGIEFIPAFNIVFHEEVSFAFIKKKYFELLNLLYLLFGYDLDVDEIKFINNDTSFSYYYKQRLDRTYDRNQLVPLGHNLKFNDNNILETPIEIFQKYFRLNDLQKQFFQSFKKYRQFKYGEEKFLGYFRILENIMFDEEILTKEKADDLLTQLSHIDFNKSTNLT
ncbi:MAG: hypothetical protein EOL93_02100 [Epsilonproteobacteria bacterium]|nr:hypothetical protein [Campylobacterota bacterium]